MVAPAPSPVAVRSSLHAWVLATRPRTLTAALAPVGVGTGLAFGEGRGAWLPALMALVGALLIQVGTNLTNDYYDHKKGADTHERLGPTRVTQSGLLAPRAVLAAALACFALAIASGTYLVSVGGWPVVAIGLVSVLCGYAYTGGPFPLAYHGLGDVFVLVFFGFVAVMGTYYVQALDVGASAAWASIPVGALGVALLAVNNTRDRHTDVKAGKRTLVVRLGRRAGEVEYLAMLAASFLTPPLMLALGYANAWVLLPLLSGPLALAPTRRVLRAEGRELNPALGGTARLQLVFGLLFALGLALGAGRAG